MRWDLVTTVAIGVLGVTTSLPSALSRVQSVTIVVRLATFSQLANNSSTLRGEVRVAVRTVMLEDRDTKFRPYRLITQIIHSITSLQ